jgi:hypothetical protein
MSVFLARRESAVKTEDRDSSDDTSDDEAEKQPKIKRCCELALQIDRLKRKHAAKKHKITVQIAEHDAKVQAEVKAEAESPPSCAEVEPPSWRRTLHHCSSDAVTIVGDYLKDIVPPTSVVELNRGKTALLSVPQHTVAIIGKLGLDYKYLTSTKRKRHIGSE